MDVWLAILSHLASSVFFIVVVFNPPCVVDVPEMITEVLETYILSLSSLLKKVHFLSVGNQRSMSYYQVKNHSKEDKVLYLELVVK